MTNASQYDPKTGEVLRQEDTAVMEVPSPIELSVVGLRVSGDLSFEEWHDFGQQLQAIEGAIQWWIGDWYNYGNATYGDVANQAVDEYGFSYDRIKQYLWVSSKVAPVLRNTDLSWSHHYQVARMEPDEQAYWLDRAATDALSVAELRREIKAAKALASLPEPSPDGANIEVFDGDALEVMRGLPIRSFDLLLTDPPYNTRRMEWDTWETDTGFVQWTLEWLQAVLPLLKPEYNAFVFCSPRNAADLEIGVLRKLELPIKSRIVWSHRNMSMGRDVADRFINTYDVVLHFGTAPLNWLAEWDDKRFDVQEYAAPQTNFADTKLHQTQKPLELIKLLCSVGSSIGDNVLDPFSGSGTTGRACLELGRNCTMIDNAFAELSARRVGAGVKRVA